MGSLFGQFSAEQGNDRFQGGGLCDSYPPGSSPEVPQLQALWGRLPAAGLRGQVEVGAQDGWAPLQESTLNWVQG